MSVWPILPGVLGVVALYAGARRRATRRAPGWWPAGAALCLVALVASAASDGGRGFVITLGWLTLGGLALALIGGTSSARRRRI